MNTDIGVGHDDTALLEVGNGGIADLDCIETRQIAVGRRDNRIRVRVGHIDRYVALITEAGVIFADSGNQHIIDETAIAIDKRDADVGRVVR